jgi:hypothetical protein
MKAASAAIFPVQTFENPIANVCVIFPEND